MINDALTAAVATYLTRCVRTADGCLVNPKLDGQYGEVRWDGRRMVAHRAVLAVHSGQIPATDIVTRHACDNRPCVAVEHLSFGTQSQNIHDAYDRKRIAGTTWARGEDRPQALLTEAVVCEMRAMARSGSSLGEVVAHFGTSYSPTRMAIRGETWAHVTTEPPVPGRRNTKPNPHAHRLTRQEDAIRVADLTDRGFSLAEVARQLGFSRHTAWTLLRTARVAAADRSAA